MARLRYLLLLAFIALALSTFVLAENDDDNTPETSTTASGSAELDERIKEHIRIAHDRNEAATRNAANDLSGLESPQATSTADADYDESPDSVDGVNRHHCHSCEKKEKKNECCCKHQPTPTYHISLCKQDERYKTISLPAQGRPFNYNDDVRHSSPPPLIKPFCTHGYCYEPCCQPTCGIYGSQPPQRLCCDHLVPCRHQPPPPPPPCCCPPPPPPCGYPPPPYGCPPPPCCCHPPPCCCPPPPPPCGCPPPPCCDCYAPPPPYVYDECLDKHKGHKNKHKGHKGHKGKHDDDY